MNLRCKTGVAGCLQSGHRKTSPSTATAVRAHVICAWCSYPGSAHAVRRVLGMVMRRRAGAMDEAWAQGLSWAARHCAVLAMLYGGGAVHAAEQGALGGASQASIRIEVSVAPRISFSSLDQSASAATGAPKLVLRCVYLNSGTGAFTLGPLQASRVGTQEAVGREAGSTAAKQGDCMRGRDASWQMPRAAGATADEAPRVILLAAQ